MFDPLSKADRYRTVAAEFANLAKSASSDFSRGCYQRIAAMRRNVGMPHVHALESFGTCRGDVAPGVRGTQDFFTGARQREHAQVAGQFLRTVQ